MNNHWIALGLITVLLTGCMNTAKKTISDLGERSYSSLGEWDHAQLCRAYKEAMKVDQFYECADNLMNREITGGPYWDEIGIKSYTAYAMAEIDLAKNDYKAVIKHASTAISLYEQGKEEYGEQVDIMKLMETDSFVIKAKAYVRLNNKQQALKTMDELESIFRESYYVFTRRAKGEIYLEIGDYEKAVHYLEWAGTRIPDALIANAVNPWAYVFEGVDANYNKRNIAKIKASYPLAKAYLESGRIEKAKIAYEKLLELYSGLTDVSESWELLFDWARVSIAKGDRTSASETLKKAVTAIETNRATMASEKSKMSFIGRKLDAYALLVQLLMDQKQYDEAFAYAERGKARALIDILASKKQFDGGDVTSVSEQNKLLAQLDTAEAKAHVLSGNKDQQSNSRSVAIHARNALVQQAPELSSLVTVKAPDVKEIQSLLPAGETLIEYYGSGDDLFAFIVTADGIRGVKLNGKGLQTDVTAFRTAILDTKGKSYQQSGNRLYNRLIAPVISGINTANLTIVPHGALHYLPFSALTANDKFLIDRYKLRILPSASVMKFLKQHQNKAGTLLAFGNPDLGNAKYDLPFAQKEAEMIAGKTAGAKLLVRGQATETAVKSYGNSFRYLHFASHGTFDAEKPLQSGLLLAKDDQNDGMLTVGELYDLNLNADLVTLSACETALGKVANGDDVVGFTRGFLYAGASSIVSSLWQVDDAATSDLMTGFYANLGKTDKRSALRNAQLSTKAKYHHPYYWAAFQITGALQ